MKWLEIQEFLPLSSVNLGGAQYNRLMQLLVSYMGILPRVFLQLCLKENENKGMVLNKKHCLGWNTWLTGAKADPARIRLIQ